MHIMILRVIAYYHFNDIYSIYQRLSDVNVTNNVNITKIIAQFFHK